MKIKIIKTKYECPSCGKVSEENRNIILDEYLDKKIELPKKKRCECGRRGGFKFLDLNIEDKL